MKTFLSLANVWTDDHQLGRIFFWLSKIGAAPRFGSRPIAWYQSHQCAAIDYLKKAAGERPLRCRSGIVQTLREGQWQNVVTASELFTIADKNCRA